MKRRGLAMFGLMACAVVIGLGVVRYAGAQAALDSIPAVRFATIDVYLDSAEPLAAWQFELTEATGAMAVVGIENGDSEAFPNAPRYDRTVINRNRADRLVVADFSLADRTLLPSGRTRVATVHVQLSGTRQPDFELQLIAAGNAAGEPIPAEAIYELEDGRAQ